MIIKDVVKVTQQLVAQILGHKYMEQNGYLEAIPADKLVDVGKDLLDMDVNVEKYTKALSVVLARREYDEGNFNPLYKAIFVTREDWGGFIERVKFDYADVMEDPAVRLEDGKSYADIEHTFYQPKVRSKIYEEAKDIMIPISIQRVMLTEAFTSYDAMGQFISRIQAKVRMTLEKCLDRYAAVLVMAAGAVSVKGINTAVYLLDEAQAAGVPGITAETTAEQALQNDEFLIFFAERIAEVRDNMKMDTNIYNNGTWEVGSTDTLLYLLTKYTRTLKFKVARGTYHREDIGFGDYESIPAWQAVRGTADGEGFTWETSSTIDFAADSENKLGLGTGEIKIPNVAGILFDRKAVGISIWKEYTTSSYTACADFWNEFIHSVTGQILDSDYPIVAFIIGRRAETQELLNAKLAKVSK